MAMLNPYNYKKPKKVIKKKRSANLHAVKNEPKTNRDKYLEQKIMAARPEQLTLMLYDGMVRFLKQGKLFMEAGQSRENVPKINNSLQRAQAIMNELQSTLDMDIEISENLDLLYDYMIRRTMEANIDKDIDVLDEVIELAEDLRDTWKEAMESL